MIDFTHVFVLTGAGISAESGLGTFRDKGGVWTTHSWEDLATPEGYSRDPKLVQGFYNARRANLVAAAPKAAHVALAELQRRRRAEGLGFTLVTQNVDDLHERGGASDVIHMHGELRAGWCLSCGWRGPWDGDMAVAGDCPVCGPEGQVRPDVVWFGEMPRHLEAIEDALAHADLFVSIGTSGSVYPAAGLVDMARGWGIATLEINLEPSEGRPFDRRRIGPATVEVPAWVDEMLGGSIRAI
jgi:NAD-dependent deacetylase